MSDVTAPNSLPDFAAPPVVEVALGVQFRSIFGLRPIELGTLRDRWRTAYPLVQEHPPVPPTVESLGIGPPPVQFVLGPALQARLWFLNEAQTELVQLQHDRLIVNWRQTSTDSSYPRYPHVRSVFEQRFAELQQFVEEHHLGTLAVTQVEITYINAIDPESGPLGRLDRVLRNWVAPSAHHLGEPEQARAAMVFAVPDVGQPPVRMYLAADPAQRPDGEPVVFLTLTVRGAPADTELGATLRFMDEAHSHVVRSFAELTPASMHTAWERQR